MRSPSLVIYVPTDSAGLLLVPVTWSLESAALQARQHVDVTCKPSIKLITKTRWVVRPGIELGMSMRLSAPCACAMTTMAKSRCDSTLAMCQHDAPHDDLRRTGLTLK